MADPEVARLVADFEDDQVDGGPGAKRNIECLHHEHQPGVQYAFLKDVQSLTVVLQDMGNPFLEESNDLLVLYTKDIMESVTGTVRKVETIGQEQYSKFVDERLSTCVTPQRSIAQEQITTLQPPSSESTFERKLQSMKTDCNLFAQIYLPCQARDGDVDQFFSHENHACPPSLSQGGKLWLGSKADLRSCLEVETAAPEASPLVYSNFLDGAAVVQMLNPGTAKTFLDYAEQVFFYPMYQHSSKISAHSCRHCLGCLSYSLRGTTRQKRGKGVRRRVVPSAAIPMNGKDCLRVGDNKTELFSFLSHQVTICRERKKHCTQLMAMMCFALWHKLT